MNASPSRYIRVHRRRSTTERSRLQLSLDRVVRRRTGVRGRRSDERHLPLAIVHLAHDVLPQLDLQTGRTGREREVELLRLELLSGLALGADRHVACGRARRLDAEPSDLLLALGIQVEGE